MLERLEQRRMLSASLSKGLLTVKASNGDDQISLNRSGGSIVVEITPEGFSQSYALSAVDRILIIAHNGDDVITIAGTISVPATILAGGGDDAITGGAGDDYIDGGPGADIFNGRTGRDTVTYRAHTAPVSVSFDNLSNDGAAGEADHIKNSIEIVIGGAGNDTLDGSGSAADLYLDGYGGSDLLIGGTGADTLVGNIGDDTLDGGAGSDDLSGSDGSDTVTYASRSTGVVVSFDGIANDGAPGEFDKVDSTVDTIIGGSGNDSISAAADDATWSKLLIGGAGNDTLTSFVANDTLRGGDGNDRLVGGSGSQFFYGDDGNDKVLAGAGHDRIYGGAGNDALYGDDGNDILRGGEGADILSGGRGSDSVLYDYMTTGVVVTIGQGIDDGAPGENDDVRRDVEHLYGGKGNDHLTGSSAKNRIRGGGGDDTINGLTGKDSLYGDDGDDELISTDEIEDILDGGDGVNVLTRK